MAKLTIPDHPTLADLHEALGPREAVKVGNNTYAVRFADGVAVTLHGHTIALFYIDGRIVVDQAGWPTVTTRERIKHLLPEGFRIHSKLGQAFITYPDGYVDELPAHGRFVVLYQNRIGR